MTTAIHPPLTNPASPKNKGRLRRVVMGGNLGDLGRLPRYVAFALLGGAVIWGPITGYLKTAPLTYKSSTSLILPGSGASASMNLNGIGQASSFANSAFASNAVSPTETYKRLLNADRILDAAADSLDISRSDLGKPRVNLVDQTSLIHFEMTGGSPAEAQSRGDAILSAFFAELDALRADEQQTREDSSLGAIQDYRASVASTRTDIEMLQSSTGLLSVAQYDALLAQNTVLEAALRNQQAIASEKEAAVRTLERSLGIGVASAAVTLKLFADDEYRQLLDQAAIHAAALADARSQYGANHPKVQEARRAKGQAEGAAISRAVALTDLSAQQLTGLDVAPNGERAALLADLVEMNAQHAGAVEQLDAMQEQLTAQTARLDQMATAAARLQDLQRDFSVAEAVFASAIARSQTTKSDVYASYPLVQVLENPSLPEAPSSPNRKLAVAAGGAATLMMLFGLLLGWTRSAIITTLIRKTTCAR
ncbi:GumC family protein [Yoonia sp. SS1-5]|uniref:GumC family protein n=1 Tax=Yoonia rhodophyticola TaxID=3137370 RepID=A0AAN0NL55_9RHOB